MKIPFQRNILHPTYLRVMLRSVDCSMVELLFLVFVCCWDGGVTRDIVAGEVVNRHIAPISVTMAVD